jgi:hypothetical protein
VNAPNPSDGSCNSCQRNKSGTVSGTISGTTLSLPMHFAAGVDGDPTPACTATMDGTAATIAAYQLSVAFTGADSCEGLFLDGTLEMTRWPTDLARRGDFDGNGRADVIWRNKVTGEGITWLMDGTTVSSSAFLPTIADIN